VSLEFLSVFIPMFVVIDPFGSLVLFSGLTHNLPEKNRRVIIRDATIYGFFILLFFIIFGNIILDFFGISIEALEVAGGIILLLMGIQMVRGIEKPVSSSSSDPSEVQDFGIVPLATPMLAGPGAISLVIILSNGGFMTQVMTIISAIILFALVYVFFSFSSRLMELIGSKTMKATTRVFGLLVAAFAIQYFINAMISLKLIK